MTFRIKEMWMRFIGHFVGIVFWRERKIPQKKPWEQSEHTQEISSISELLKFKEKQVQT